MISDRIRAFIEESIGYNLRSRDQEALDRFIALRLAQNKLPDHATYLALLRERNSPEWEALLQALLNPETYFFRDLPQLSVLRERVLPECIARSRNSRQLRLWSAGCSSGEEAYTLVIIAWEALEFAGEDPLAWRIHILGTDINRAALRTAALGIYPEWSFRQTSPAQRARWFVASGEHLEQCRVVPELKRCVRFAELNLNAPETLLPIVGTAEVILCRNVFLYLRPERLFAIVSGLASCLATNGTLICGHTELQHIDLANLAALGLHRRLFTGSTVYEKCEQKTKASKEVKAPVLKATAAKITLSDRSLSDARLLANRGEYAEALALCEQLSEAAPLSVEIYALRASISELLGATHQALELWKKVSFLAPENISAYLELAGLYERQSDVRAAARYLRAAEDILERMPSEQTIDDDKALTVGALRVFLRQRRESEQEQK
jgi:chemotaxis protein methyltransferase CheR